MQFFNNRCEKLDVFLNKHKKLLMTNNIAYVRGVIFWVISNIFMHTSQISLEESILLIIVYTCMRKIMGFFGNIKIGGHA